VVDVRFTNGAAAAVPAVRDAGAHVLALDRSLQTLAAGVAPGDLRALADLPRVAAVKPELTPISSATCPSGSIVSEGDQQLHALGAREGFEVDGSGVAVGILSDSFDEATEAADGSGPVATHKAEDVRAADLPGTANPCGQTRPVEIVEEFAPGEEEEEAQEASDEGRGMAQIVHDLAPGAAIDFASAFNGELAFAANIEALAERGASVIADDVSYLDEPFFQDGPVAVAIQTVTSRGVSYFSAAGNDNLIDSEGHDVASWEAPAYRNTTCPAGVPNSTECMNFAPSGEPDSKFEIRVAPHGSVLLDLQWAQPWGGVTTDLDAYLLRSGTVVAESEEPNVGGEPFELLSWENESPSAKTVNLAIDRCNLTCDPFADKGTPRLKFILLDEGEGVQSTEYPVSEAGDVVGPTIYGHAGSAAAIAVGAVPYYASDEAEEYSSRGPVTHYFGPVTGLTPALPLLTPETLSKPDIAATDCGLTSFFASNVAGSWRFCGTSAAAPHAAAVAALMDQASNCALTPQDVRAALTQSAVAVGAFGPDAVGSGLVEAEGALAAAEARVTEEEVEASACPTLPDLPAEETEEEPEEEQHEEEPEEEPEVQPPPGGGPTPPVAAAPPPSGKAPFALRAVIAKHPRRVVRTRRHRARVVFRFRANERGVVFLCRVDRQRFHRCSRKLVRRLADGRHVVRLKGRDAAGNVDRTADVYRFRVRRRA
jgi:subtilisin family serine protease